MPMMRITTRSSMSVKPFSSPLIRWESFRSMVTPPWEPVVLPVTSAAPSRWQLGQLRRGEPPLIRSPGALRPRLATGLPLHRGPDSYWGHLSTQAPGNLSGPSVHACGSHPPTIVGVHLRRALLLFALVLGLTALAAAVSPSREKDEPPVPPPAAVAGSPPGPVVPRTVAFRARSTGR